MSDKIKLISNLLNMCDNLVIGGGMAFTFKAVHDKMNIGHSLFDVAGSKIVNKIIDKAKEKGVSLSLPVDYVTGDKIGPDAKVGTATDESGIADDMMGLDIGPESIEHFKEIIMNAKTIVFNGPVGVFEQPAFANGTKAILQAIAEATAKGALR